MKPILAFIILLISIDLQAQAVGIGTTTPNPLFKLDVNGPIISAGLRTIGINNSISFHDQIRTSRYFTWKANNGYARFSFNKPSIEQNLIVVDSLGHFGLGTLNPTAWLEVNTSTDEQTARFNGGDDMWITLAENGINRGYIGSYSGNSNDVGP